LKSKSGGIFGVPSTKLLHAQKLLKKIKCILSFFDKQKWKEFLVVHPPSAPQIITP
jgi:hypothetical protein